MALFRYDVMVKNTDEKNNCRNGLTLNLHNIIIAGL